MHRVADPKTLDPFQSPDAYYGSELRRLREEAQLSQERLGALVFISGAYVGQIETAIRRPRVDLSIRFDAALESGGYLERLCRMVRKARPIHMNGHATYFAEAADHESRATSICEYAHTLVPGLLQTEGYIRAVVDAYNLQFQPSEVDELVRVRLERAARLDDSTRPEFWAILQESVLRIPVGGPSAMAEQLRSIAARAHSGRIIVQILPFADGPHSMMAGMVSLMSFDDAPDLAYSEGMHSGQLLDESEPVSLCWKSYDLARAAALSPKASLALLDSVAEEYTHAAEQS